MATPSEDVGNTIKSNSSLVPRGNIFSLPNGFSAKNGKMTAEEVQISKYYQKLGEEDLNRHIRLLLVEAVKRHELQQPEIIPSTSSALPTSSAPSTPPEAPSTSPESLREPKQELLDEEYLTIHSNSTGISYNPKTSSFIWNRIPIANEFMNSSVQKDGARRVNELNNYNQEKSRLQPTSSEPPAKKNRTVEVKSRLSETYWSRKGGDPFVDCFCSKCDKKFTSIRDLLDHRHLNHSQKDMLTCGICQKEFQKRTHIFLHLSQEYKLYQCSACQGSFSSKYHRDKHNCLEKSPEVVNVVRNRERSRIREGEEDDDVIEVDLHCEMCGKQYFQSHWLQKHRDKCTKKKEDNEVKTEYTCNICHRKYCSLFWYERHRKKTCVPPASIPRSSYVFTPKKPPPPGSATCEYCHHTFTNQFWLNYHLKNCQHAASARRAKDQQEQEQLYVEEDAEMPVLMKYTKDDVKMEDMSADEEEVEDGEDEAPNLGAPVDIRCSLCGMDFEAVSPLLSHRKNIHGNGAMLTCGLCNKKCNSISSIRRHINQEYSVYKCSSCGKNCLDRTTLVRHLCAPPDDPNVPSTSTRRAKSPFIGKNFGVKSELPVREATKHVAEIVLLEVATPQRVEMVQENPLPSNPQWSLYNCEFFL